MHVALIAAASNCGSKRSRRDVCEALPVVLEQTWSQSEREREGVEKDKGRRSYASIVVQHLDDDFDEGARVEGGDDGVLHHLAHDHLLLPLTRACFTTQQCEHATPHECDLVVMSLQPAGEQREEGAPPTPLAGLQWTLIVARSRISSLCFTSIGP
jgi:hypothetical protein